MEATKAMTAPSGFFIAPDSDQTLVLEPGEIGGDGSCEITKVAGRALPGEQNAGKFYVSIGVAYESPEHGRVFLETSPFGPFNTQTGSRTGSKLIQFLGQLGLEPVFATEADEQGNYAYAGAGSPVGMKVWVKVGVEKRKGVRRNVIENIGARA